MFSLNTPTKLRLKPTSKGDVREGAFRFPRTPVGWYLFLEWPTWRSPSPSLPESTWYTTPYGRRVALFLTKLYGCIIRPGLQALDSHLTAQAPPPLQKAFAAVDVATEAMIREARLAA